MKTPVNQFETILLATLQLASSMEKANMSTQKLLQETLARNPKPSVESFLRMAKAIGTTWSALLRQGKAPTRKARDGAEKEQLLAHAKTKRLRVDKKRRKK